MRSRMPLALVLSLALAACGDAPKPTPAGPVGVWSVSKPNPMVGRLRATVVDRPTPRIARIRVEYQPHILATNAGLSLVLPEGVELIDGDAMVPLFDSLEGAYEWIVSFPKDRTLDATVRMFADTEGGQRACEAAVRLVTAP